jgi:hypothetical protein
MPSLFTPLWYRHAVRPRSVRRVWGLEQWSTRKPANLLQRVRFSATRPAREEVLCSHPWLALLALDRGAFIAHELRNEIAPTSK